MLVRGEALCGHHQHFVCVSELFTMSETISKQNERFERGIMQPGCSEVSCTVTTLRHLQPCTLLGGLNCQCVVMTVPRMSSIILCEPNCFFPQVWNLLVLLYDYAAWLEIACGGIYGEHVIWQFIGIQYENARVTAIYVRSNIRESTTTMLFCIK